MNIWTYLIYLNLILSLAIFVYLYHFLHYRRIAERSEIHTFITLIKPEQSYLFITGFFLWTLAFLFEALYSVGNPFLVSPVKTDLPFILHVTRPAVLAAATMYIGHGLMFFAALPVREGRKIPKLDRIDWLRRIGLLFLLALWFSSLFYGWDSNYWSVVIRIYVFLQWTILLHVYMMIWHSTHPLRTHIIFLLLIWFFSIPAQIAQSAETAIFGDRFFYIWTIDSPHGTWREEGICTLTLIAFFTLLVRANFLYVKETFRRAKTFRSEKDIMLSFLKKLTLRKSFNPSLKGNDKSTNDGVLSDLDLDRLVRITLEFGKQYCQAGAGALYVRDDIQEILTEPLFVSDKGKFLSARVVMGMYPPNLDVSHFLSDFVLDEDVLHDLVRSEKVPVGVGPVGWVAKTSEALLIQNAEEDERVIQQEEPNLKIRSILAVPLRVQNNTVAVLSLINKRHGRVPFTLEDEATLQAMAEQAAMTLSRAVLYNTIRENERLERDIELAKEVQQLLLPKECPHIKGFDIAAINDSAQEIGGDYYDFFWPDENHLAVVIADVSGKGVAGALTMASVRSALRAISGGGLSAREMLIRLNQFLLPDLKRGTFISMLLVYLDIRTGSIDVARAGHEPLLILKYKSKSYKKISPTGITLGIVNGELFDRYTQQDRVNLNAGDVAVLYTDGITEAMNRQMEEFTFDRFIKTLLESRTQSAQDIVDNTCARLAYFTGATPQNDDITLVVIKRTA